MPIKSPSPKNVLAALPGIQAAIRREAAVRIAAGEEIASSESPEIREKIEARRIALEQHASRRTKAVRKSAA